MLQYRANNILVQLLAHRLLLRNMFQKGDWLGWWDFTAVSDCTDPSACCQLCSYQWLNWSLVIIYHEDHSWYQRWRKVVKLGRANWQRRTYFYGKNKNPMEYSENPVGLQPHSPTLSAAYAWYNSIIIAPLKDAIRLWFIPTLTGYVSCSSILRDLFALLCHLGRMGIVNHIDTGDSQYDASVKVTGPIKDFIMHQSLTASPPDVCSIKADIHNHHCYANKAKAQAVYASLFQPLQRARDLNSENSSSSWLIVLPFRDQGFHLTKHEFWDAIHLQYS